MNFKRYEGMRSPDLYDIIGDDLQRDLASSLSLKGKISKEFEEDGCNKSAFVTYNNKNYPNETYSFSCDILSEVEEGFKLLKKQILSESEMCKFISFRMSRGFWIIYSLYFGFL